MAAVARAKDWSYSVASTSVMPLFYGTPGSGSRSRDTECGMSVHPGGWVIMSNYATRFGLAGVDG